MLYLSGISLISIIFHFIFCYYIGTAKKHAIIACSVKSILQKPRRSHGISLRAKPRSFFLFYFSSRARICLGSIRSKATKRSTSFPSLTYTRSDAASASNGQERRQRTGIVPLLIMSEAPCTSRHNCSDLVFYFYNITITC